ncbi:MAG: PAS domain-containing protein [Litorimonas sp.]
MLFENALRHQIILPEQREFYDYWRSKCKAGKIPSRKDILPEDIKAQLPMTSIVECDDTDGSTRYRFRLAGTGYWNLYNREIQGQYLDQLPIGCRTDYWTKILDKVMTNAKPYVGVTRPNTPNGTHLAQFWVRLPLSDNGTDINMVLGFDHLMKLSAIPQMQEEQEKIYA